MATIYDIAREVGVSTTTVSNAFNHPEQMKPATRQKIIETATRLGYQPNINAQALAGGKSRFVALLVSDIRTPLVANIARGVEDRLLESNLIPVIVSTDGQTGKTVAMQQMLMRNGITGYILIPSHHGVPRDMLSKIIEIQASGLPIVVAGYDAKSDQISTCSIHAQKAAFDLVEHFIKLGHRHIGYVGSYFSRGYATQRWVGFQEALMTYQIQPRAELFVEVESTPQAAFEGMARLMAQADPPTAIVASSDVYATGVIDYANIHNIEVPAEMSLGTFDFSPFVQRLTPSITSIVVSGHEVGRKSAALFLDVQNNPQEPKQVYLDHELEVRETSAQHPV